MLKKLAKYGNSTTLVIDKAILELLGMDETSVVKLQTNGVSLIITPVSAEDKDKKISYTPHEALQTIADHRRALREDAQKALDARQVDKEEMAKMQQDFKAVFQKHSDLAVRFAQLMTTKEFQEAIEDATSHLDPVTQQQEYLTEWNKVRNKFIPEFEAQDKELEAIGKKYPSLL